MSKRKTVVVWAVVCADGVIHRGGAPKHPYMWTESPYEPNPENAEDEARFFASAQDDAEEPCGPHVALKLTGEYPVARKKGER